MFESLLWLLVKWKGEVGVDCEVDFDGQSSGNFGIPLT